MRLGRRALEGIASSIAARRAEERRRREERGRLSASPMRERGEPEGPLGPTSEQRSAFSLERITDRRPGGTTVNLGRAYRRKPMIDTLAEQGILSDAEHRALKHYRHHADIADRSPVRDSLCMVRVGGESSGPTHNLLNAIQVAASCERAAGSLADILRSVAVYDQSLSQWAIDRSGGIDDGGRIKPRQKALAIARLEFQMAAKRVESELAA